MKTRVALRRRARSDNGPELPYHVTSDSVGNRPEQVGHRGSSDARLSALAVPDVRTLYPAECVEVPTFTLMPDSDEPRGRACYGSR